MTCEDELSPQFQTGAGTDRGHVRAANEDHFLAAQETGLWAVSDGMGGHVGGAFASAAITEALAAVLVAPSAAGLLNACEDALARANDRIRAFAAQCGGAMVGATVVALLIFEQRYACLWCGDSRAYLVRDGAIRQVSRDHSEVQDLLDAGAITAQQASAWPGRNVLTRAVGVSDDVETDMVEGVLEQGDIFVLCSDGLTGHLSDADICRIVLRRPAASGCQDLIDLALERGGKDNVTAIVVHYRPEPTLRSSRAASGDERAASGEEG